MLLFRLAQPKDLPKILKLAATSRTGLTNLPANRKIIHDYIVRTQKSIRFKKVNQPDHEHFYLFVLENTKTKKLIGTSAISPIAGHNNLFYNFKVTEHTRISRSLDIHHHYQCLQLVNDLENHSELCALFLDHTHRARGTGRFLSLARLSFIALFPERFSPRLFAELRGYLDDKGRSPFWHALAEKFIPISFGEADRLTVTSDKQFIADLMPRTPILVPLLSKKAQQVIAKPHRATLPAYKILQGQGFHYTGYIDIFDGGPSLEIYRDNLPQLRHPNLATLAEIGPVKPQQEYIVCTTTADFKALCCPVQWISPTQIQLPADKVKQLGVNLGDTLKLSVFP